MQRVLPIWTLFEVVALSSIGEVGKRSVSGKGGRGGGVDCQAERIMGVHQYQFVATRCQPQNR